MSKEEYGLYTYWLSIYLILLNLIPFGTVAASSVFRFNLKPEQYRNILFTSLFIIIPVVFMGVLSFFYVKSLIYSSSFLIDFTAAIAALFYGVSLILLSIFRVDQKFKVYSILFISYVSLVSLFQVVAYLVFESFESVIYGFTLGMIMSGIISLFMLMRIFKIELSINAMQSSITTLPKLVRYGFPLVLGSVSMSVMVVGDKIIMKNLITDYDMGIYSSVAVVCSTALFLVNNFASAWGGYLIKQLSNLEKLESKVIFKRTQVKIIPIFIVLSLLTVNAQVVLYAVLYGFKEDRYLYALVSISLGYCIYGASKYYIGFMMYYRKNFDILKGTMLGICGLLVVSNIGIGDPVIRVSIAVVIAFSLQLLYLALFVNKNIYGEIGNVL
jgi:O-antigen/teichoic acid export membrane protein